jgi:CubicO group peptidase (beta-lactamase class C family)
MRVLLISLMLVAVPVSGLVAQPNTKDTDTSAIAKVFAESVRRHEPVAGSGIAVAVLKDRKLFYAGALGLRDRAASSPVTIDTLFPIGSSTKPFTSMALAMLAERKSVELGQPVKRYLTDFFMQDQEAQANATLEDILSHRTGLPRHDALWYLAPFSRIHLVHRLRYLDPSALPGHGFRRAFEYNNMTYSVAAYVVEVVTGERWDSFIKTNILNPLQMQATSFTLADLMREPNRAKAYQGDKELPPLDFDNIGPAGAINSNVRDLAGWVSLHLNRGITPTGARIVEPATFDKLYEGHIDVDPNQGVTYGLGWFVVRNQAKRLVHHGGNPLGYTALVSLMPDEGVGMAILTNQHASKLPQQVSCDLYLHLLPQIADAFCSAERVAQIESINLMPASRAEPGSVAPLRASPSSMPPLGDYAGMYSNGGYGDISVSIQGSNLHISYYRHSWPLQPFDRDLYFFSLDAFGGSYPFVPVEFSRTSTGQVEKLTIPFERDVGAIRFMKR